MHKLGKVGEETRKTERKEFTPLQIAELKVKTLEGEIKVWMHRCEELEKQLAAKDAAFDDLMQDSDFEEIL